MGSIDSRPLKAFVRFDGSGRIVAGSLVLRKNKPKVGKWREILAYECCNYIPATTTTTSTTVVPLINSTNLFVQCIPNTPCGLACSLPLGYFDVWMTQADIDVFPAPGCVVWTDAAGTIPFPNGLYNDGSGLFCITIVDGVTV